jgi:hypothetical protein
LTISKLDRFEFHDLESVLAVTYDAATGTVTCWFGNAPLVTTESGGWNAEFGTAVGITADGQVALDLAWTEHPILLDADIPSHEQHPIDLIADVAQDIARCAHSLAPHVDTIRAREISVGKLWDALGTVLDGETLKLTRIALVHLWVGMNPLWDLERL